MKSMQGNGSGRPACGVGSATAVVAAACACLAPLQAQAAESGIGFYLLGSRGPLAGAVPPPGFYLQNDVYIYSGSAGANIDLPIGGGDDRTEGPTVMAKVVKGMRS